MTDTQQNSGLAGTRTLDRRRDGPLPAERVVRRLIDEAFSQGHLGVCDELIADDIVEHQDYGPGHPPGAAGVKAVVTSLRRAFSDYKLEIEDWSSPAIPSGRAMSQRARTTARTWAIRQPVTRLESMLLI